MTPEELSTALANEIRILLHLLSKVEPARLDYRPTSGQRSLLELLQYLTVVGPIHARAVADPAFDLDAWRAAWTQGEAEAKARNLDQIREALAGQPALFASLLADADLSAPIEMFGNRASRGLMWVNLVLCHLAAYRMQVFLYLKSTGREELNTFNLWLGMDPPQPVAGNGPAAALTSP